ncbi:heavy metal-associated domain-containing protein [uncultured Gilvimarinus sp.]|uniref:heavy-metal-associated domain-containing protein n=1 Tax=uncultured Gilvimarinus sp. TaxID=1689143 RepID=UPI0030DB08C3
MNNDIVSNTTEVKARGCCCAKPSQAKAGGGSSPSTDKDTPVYKLSVKGAHCGGCKARIEQALSSVAGVTGATMDLESGIALVSGSVAAEALLEALDGANYSASIID